MNRLSIQKIKELGIDEDAVTMLSDAMNSGIGKMLKSKQYHPLSKDNSLKLFKLAEINVQLQNKVEHFQKATIMNIAESVTANNWEVLPPKYLEAMNFTKQEIAQLATISSSEASKVLSAKLDSIVANPNEYKSVLEKMSKLAQSAITKEEKAVIQLIGTADEAGTLSEIKDLMEASANENLGKFVNKVKKSSLGESLRVYYQTAIFDIQKKMRNTIDSFVRPIKALDTFHDIEQKVVDILGKDEEAFIAKVKDPNSPYYMFEKMDYQQAKKSLTKYIKDIALDKNDINNWTTKFEHNIPGGKRGMKYNLNLVKSIADVVNGDVGKSTEQIIGESFAKKCNINNTVMRYRFLNLEYKLAKDYKKGGCYMKVKFPAEQLVKNICEGDFSQLHILEALIDERKSELSLDSIGKLKEIRDTARKGYQYKVDNWTKFRDEVVSLLDFKTSNKSISEMAGKNVTDFFVNAAQSARSRNKWAKFAYGLLIGTTALSAIFIANIGRKNNFNKDKYEYKNFAQGVNK